MQSPYPPPTTPRQPPDVDPGTLPPIEEPPDPIPVPPSDDPVPPMQDPPPGVLIAIAVARQSVREHVFA